MNISLTNLNKLNFKGIPKQSDTSTDKTSYANTLTKTNLLSNSINAAQIGLNKPVSYNKIADIPVGECREPAQLYKLATGQKVVILPKEGSAVVRTFYNVGSMNEPDHLRGISHYIEHNLFNGTDKLGPGEFFQRVADLGASTNAMTGYNQTNYYIKSQLLDDNYLENIIKLHADQVQNPKFAQDQLEKEKGPVTSEISMYADSPFNVGRNLALKNLYQINSSSEDLIAGTIKNINEITRKDVVDYYNTWYTPDNAITVIAGDVNPQKAIELVSKNFTKTKTTQVQNKKFEELTPLNKTVRVDVKKPNCSSTIINMGFAGPENINTKDKIAIEVLSVILTGFTNSRLTKALEPTLCDAEFSTEKIGNKPTDRQAIYIGASAPEEKSEEVLKTIYSEISKFNQAPPSQEEFDIAINKLKMGLSLSSERSSELSDFIGSAFLDNDINYLTNYKNILESLTPQDVHNASKKYLNLNKTSISVVHPSSSSNEAIQNNYKTTNNSQPKKIAFGNAMKKVDELHSDVKEYKLQNNIETAIRNSNTNIASYNINLSLPSYIDATTPEFEILKEILNQGSVYKNNNEFDKELEKSNIEMAIGVLSNGLNIHAILPSNKLNESLNLTKEALLNPRFTQEEFAKAKQTLKEEIEGMPKSARNKLHAELFPHLKYMQTTEETLKQIDSVSLDKVIGLYQTILSNASGQAVLSAPVRKNPQLQADFLNSLSRDIPTLKPVSKNIINTYVANTEEKVLTETEERLQSEVIQAYKFKTTGNVEDQAKFILMNMILGGNSSSRLFTDLRESQKLAYYVRSHLINEGNTGIVKLSILTTTDDENDPTSTPENINRSLAGYQKHINKMQTELVSDEELEKAKLIIKNGILNSLETSMDKASNLSASIKSPYGLNKTSILLDAIEKTTPQDIQNAAVYAFKNPPITSILASENTLKETGFLEK